MSSRVQNAVKLSQPKALLFDLDGCLMDTAPDFFPTVNSLRKEHKLPPLADDIIRQQVSNGGRALTRLALDLPQVKGNQVGDTAFEKQRQKLLDLYVEHIASESSLFDGMVELLQSCHQKGLAWGIVTNKPKLYTELLLERLSKRIEVLSQCSVVICPDDVKNSKPDPEPLLLAAKKLSLAVDDCWYLGDHERDITAGKAAKMTTIATLYGYIEPHDDPTHWQADIMVETVDEIIELVKTNT